MWRQIATILVFSAASALALPLLCAEDLAVNGKLKDKRFTDGIVQCLMDQKPCSNTFERNIKSESVASLGHY